MKNPKLDITQCLQRKNLIAVLIPPSGSCVESINSLADKVWVLGCQFSGINIRDRSLSRYWLIVLDCKSNNFFGKRRKRARKCDYRAKKLWKTRRNLLDDM